jgi:hypothetical protein
MCRCSWTCASLDSRAIDRPPARSLHPARLQGNDGQLHEELAQTCSCGFTPTAPGDLDPHFLAAFLPANSMGADGKIHTLVG